MYLKKHHIYLIYKMAKNDIYTNKRWQANLAYHIKMLVDLCMWVNLLFKFNNHIHFYSQKVKNIRYLN